MDVDTNVVTNMGLGVGTVVGGTTSTKAPSPPAPPPPPPPPPLLSPIFHLHVASSDLNAITGHHTINACIEEIRPNGDIVKSPMETHGIDGIALQRKFDGDIDKWRNHTAMDMLNRHHARATVQSAMLQWQGRKFAIK